MIHLGDITKIHGDQIEPVDCITFGSPCQDLSMAGLRAGLEGKNSGLFTEAIRVIVEMTAGLWHGGCSTLNVGECPSVESVSQLSQILEVNVPQRYFLSARACQGILTRASRRGKALPDLLKTALLDMIEWWQGRQPTP